MTQIYHSLVYTQKTTYSTDTCSAIFLAPIFTVARNRNNQSVLQQMNGSILLLYITMLLPIMFTVITLPMYLRILSIITKSAIYSKKILWVLQRFRDCFRFFSVLSALEIWELPLWSSGCQAGCSGPRCPIYSLKWAEDTSNKSTSFSDLSYLSVKMSLDENFFISPEEHILKTNPVFILKLWGKTIVGCTTTQ